MIDDVLSILKTWQAGRDYANTPKWDIRDGNLDELEYVDEVDMGEGRWQSYRWIVFKYKGKLFATEIAEGLTEMQEDEYYPNAFEVEQKEIVTTTYLKV